jgi:hypothetical protein
MGNIPKPGAVRIFVCPTDCLYLHLKISLKDSPYEAEDKRTRTAPQEKTLGCRRQTPQEHGARQNKIDDGG